MINGPHQTDPRVISSSNLYRPKRDQWLTTIPLLSTSLCTAPTPGITTDSRRSHVNQLPNVLFSDPRHATRYGYEDELMGIGLTIEGCAGRDCSGRGEHYCSGEQSSFLSPTEHPGPRKRSGAPATPPGASLGPRRPHKYHRAHDRSP